ncbi:MAG: glycoside hydrolase family 2 protein [Gammaproteobacteria bacterium]|nr:MAG: glycoside hydrolase family 2 protein [Gammaproteobacteria bacterium]
MSESGRNPTKSRKYPSSERGFSSDMIDFNDNWLFTLSDSPDYTLTTYTPHSWKPIHLPHDWSVEFDFSRDLEGCTAFLPGGIGWYTKTFATPIHKQYQKCHIIFDGVYNNAEFWINGMKIGEHPYGYAPITYDLTRYLMPYGQDNRIAVRVDHSRYADSRWYTGSGIYRNVKLLITDRLHIPVWGIFITTPRITDEYAEVEIRVEVKNNHAEDRSANIATTIFDTYNQRIASADTLVSLQGHEDSVYTLKTRIPNPNLWNLNDPYLYRAVTSLVVDERILEERSTRFGIRSFHFDKDSGFRLNGNNLKIKGVCLHHDAGPVGAAVPKDVWRRRLQLLKECGCNAIRSAHNPASEEFLDLCDEMGLLVQNEFYDEWDLPKDKRYNMQDKEIDAITRGHAQHFQRWAEIDLKNTMRSSRNHPCIFQWSIGNEIEWTYPGNREATGIFKNTNANEKLDWTLWRSSIPPNNPEEVRKFWRNYPEQMFNIGDTAQKLATWTREMDTTRPVTANCILPTSSFETGYTDVLDVVGLSYKPHQYDYLKQHYPDKCMMGTENVPRWYEWKAVVERDFIPGVFLWTGVDYLGECRAEHWPIKVTPHGLLDIAGFPRPSYYMFQSLWRNDIPVLAMYTQTESKSIFCRNENGYAVEKEPGGWKQAPRQWQDVNPHWNYNPEQTIIVEVYSNCDTVELYLNGESQGAQQLQDHEDRIYKWAVPYYPGELLAKGTIGTAITTASLQTAGPPTGIHLMADRNRIQPNNTDTVHIVAQLVDEQGRPVRHVDEEITFHIKGDCRFMGTACSNTAKLLGFRHTTVATDFGRCLLVVQAPGKPDEITIHAESIETGMSSNTLTIAAHNSGL